MMDENQKWSQAALIKCLSHYCSKHRVAEPHPPTLLLLLLLLLLHLALLHVTQFGFSDASGITDGLQEAGATV